MRTLIFRGYSDDTFREYGIPESVVIGRKLIVTGEYSRVGGGTWDIGVSLYDDSVLAPDWAMRLRFEDISTVLEVDVPDGTELEWYMGDKLVKKEMV